MPRRSRNELATPFHLVDTDYSIETPPPPPPNHLSEATKAWWNEVCAEFVLRPHHLKVLEIACDSWDEMVRAREVLRVEGFTVPTKASGPKRHPCADIERDARLAFARLLRELDLDADMPPPERGPNWRPSPALRSNRRR